METAFLLWFLKYYLQTSWSIRKINENSKFYVSNDLVWYWNYNHESHNFRNSSFVYFFFLFVRFSNFYFIQESSICSNFSFACLWRTSRQFVAVICQCLLFFLQRENCSSQAACTGYGTALEGRLIAFLVFDPTYQRLCQSIWTGGATNLDKGAFGSAHFAISLTTNSSTDNRL